MIYDLSEERLTEISKNPVSEDYVFCSECEKALGEYIESPYASFYKNGQKVSKEIPLLFWISVAWRLSTQGNNGFSLGTDLNEELRVILFQYLKLRKEDKCIDDWAINRNISYSIVTCTDYCRSEGGMFHCDYDSVNLRLTMFIGDVCISISFNDVNYPQNFTFYGMESYLTQACVNNGTVPEQRIEVLKEDFRRSMKFFIEKAARIRKAGLFELADAVWKASGRILFMPLRMKCEFVERIICDGVKMGERYTSKHIVDTLNEVTKDITLYI